MHHYTPRRTHARTLSNWKWKCSCWFNAMKQPMLGYLYLDWTIALMLLDDKFQSVLTVKLYLTHGSFWDWWWIYSTLLTLVQFELWNEWNALPITVRQSCAHTIFKKNVKTLPFWQAFLLLCINFTLQSIFLLKNHRATGQLVYLALCICYYSYSDYYYN